MRESNAIDILREILEGHLGVDPADLTEDCLLVDDLGLDQADFSDVVNALRRRVVQPIDVEASGDRYLNSLRYEVTFNGTAVVIDDFPTLTLRRCAELLDRLLSAQPTVLSPPLDRRSANTFTRRSPRPR